MSIATELALLANTKESLRVAIGLSTSIPFSQYAVNIPWGSDVIPPTGIVFDFKKNRYAKDGKAVYLDDMPSQFIRLSSATKWHDGQLVEVPNNVPRISGVGMLIEPQRTNLFPSSINVGITAAGWISTLATITPTPTPAPSGGTGVTAITPNDDTQSFYQVTRNNPRTEATQYTFSIFVKNESLVAGNTITLRQQFSGSDYALVTFDANTYEVLSEVGIGNHSSVSGSATAVGSGWYRLHMIFTVNEIVTGLSLRVVLNKALAGTLGSCYLWGAQLEDGSLLTSYIPTSGTPVTRSPDILNIPLLPTQTITGDRDAGVTYSVAGGIATFEGHGYIRNITVEAL